MTSTLIFFFFNVVRPACESKRTGRARSDCCRAYKESLDTAVPLLAYIHLLSGHAQTKAPKGPFYLNVWGGVLLLPPFFYRLF